MTNELYPSDIRELFYYDRFVVRHDVKFDTGEQLCISHGFTNKGSADELAKFRQISLARLRFEHEKRGKPGVVVLSVPVGFSTPDWASSWRG